MCMQSVVSAGEPVTTTKGSTVTQYCITMSHQPALHGTAFLLSCSRLKHNRRFFGARELSATKVFFQGVRLLRSHVGYIKEVYEMICNALSLGLQTLLRL